MKVFCIIPALNEEKTIGQVIARVKPFVDEIVVVDDGSSDSTVEISAKAGATVLEHLINRGQGASLETGNLYALKNGAEIVLHFDADGQFVPEEINDLLKPIIMGEAEVVFGSRFLGRPSNMPFFKKNIIMPIARLVNKVLLNLSLSDPQSGLRVFYRPALEKIRIEQDRMAHASEILYKVSFYKLKIKEVPATVIYTEFGQSFSGGVRIVKDLLLAKFLDN
jgi:glycosyltransferase involved in cell wall biosynthesis